MLIGKTLKIIRENRGLSQQAFSKGIVSPSYYSKVEAGSSEISANLLFELLEASNTTIKEFYYIKKSYKSESQINIFKQMRLYFNKGDLSALVTLETELRERSTDDNYLLIIENLKNYLQENKLDQNALMTLKKYLGNIPSWGHYEFQLFALCSYLFEAGTLILLSNNIVRNIEKYEDFANYEQDLLTILINLVRALLRGNKIDEAHYFLQLAKSTHKNPLFIYEKLLIEYFDCLLHLKDKRKESETKANEIINFFKRIDLVHTAKNLDVVLQEQLVKLN